MLTTIYRGSAKDVLGPVKINGTPSVVFRYTDAYSVFDWGRMPDAIPNKGAALAILSADLFEKFKSPAHWKEFSKSETAHEIRKGISSIKVHQFAKNFRPDWKPVSLASSFNEMGEEIQKNGMRCHYHGCLTDNQTELAEDQLSCKTQPLSEMKEVFHQIGVEQVSVVHPRLETTMGKMVMDYHPTRTAPPPRLIPLEVVFRFGCPAGNSLLEYLNRYPDYLEQLVLPQGVERDDFRQWKTFEFPVMELTTKLESADRRLPLTEAMAISGLSALQMEEMFLRSVWIGGFLKDQFRKHRLELSDGKLEWAIDPDGKLILVDAVGLDEIRILNGKNQLSKEFLRAHYRNTAWYGEVKRAKEKAEASGDQEWKKQVTLEPERLPEDKLLAASQIYQTIVNLITGKRWFDSGWSIEKLLEEIENQMSHTQNNLPLDEGNSERGAAP